MVDDMSDVIAGGGRELNVRALPHCRSLRCLRSDHAHTHRKLIGTVLLLIFLAIYVAAAVSIGEGHVVSAPAWVQLAYFLAAGLAWVFPAGLLIKWMQKP